MSILQVTDLCKKYPEFTLKNVSFNLEEGKITGLIGRNGAGKSTTLKSLFNFVHPDSGSIKFFDKDFNENEIEIKSNIGFVSGAVDYYQKKKLKTITDITKNFYAKWDNEAYKNYLSIFKLKEDKTPEQLSAGMKIKYALALALSHNAKLLILDEPTSGLDPVSRDELMDIFLDLSDKGITILFSTHITSDLEKCADNIIYIKNGTVAANDNMKNFVSKYKIVEFKNENIEDNLKSKLIGFKRSKEGYSAVIRTEVAISENLRYIDADLENIMVHFEKEEA